MPDLVPAKATALLDEEGEIKRVEMISLDTPGGNFLKSCLIVQDWRPIEQADKSGRYLLLIKLKYAAIGKYEYAMVEGFWDHDFEAWTAVSGRKCEPTHFTNVLPLPAELP